MKRGIICAFLALGIISCWAALGEGAPGAVGDLLKQAGISHGVCCVLGCDDPTFPIALVRSSGFLVHVLDPRDSAVAAARKAAEEAGFGIERLIIEKAAPDHLPYADNTVDLVVDTGSNGPQPAEVLRVLRPRGKAIACTGTKAAVTATKPALAGVDNWSHWEHGPDNNPVSTDAVIRAPYMTQWLAQPYYIAMPAITTAAGGRTFVAMGHIAHHEREEPWLNTLLARNGYNGAELWRRRLPDGYLVHRSAFIATDDTFYMIDPSGDGCLLLDPETGEESGRLRVPEVKGDWKWIALHDGVLFALVGEERDPGELTVVRSPYPAWSWGELSPGYYKEEVPWGFGRTMLAYDLGGKALVWSHAEDKRVDSRGMAIGDGKVFFYGPDSRIGCLDAKSGQVVWANDDAEVRRLIEEPGRGLGSTPGFRTACFCVYTPKGLYFEEQTHQNMVALSKEDGHLLWHRTKTTNNPNVIYLDDTVFAGLGPDGRTLALDPMTGETRADLGFAKRSCARLTATTDSLFCRGMPEGVTRYDRASKKVTFDGSMRPACNDGVIGANGLLYIGPWLCDCNLSIMGAAALCSAQDIKPGAQQAERLEAADKAAERVSGLDVSHKDWYGYRGGNDHTGSAKVSVSHLLFPVWTYAPSRPYEPTAPTAAGGLVFVTGDDGLVRALAADTGHVKWTMATCGPIVQPPTLWQGRAYVGSGDGYVYALDAGTGQPLWRFRAAPIERRIMVYGRLCSTWPVNTGVLVNDGVAYCAAGIIDYDGTYVYALDAKSGAVKWANDSSGHLDPALRKGVSGQGNLTALGDALWMAGGNVVSPAPYDIKTGAYKGPSAGDGSSRANRGEEIGVFRDEFFIRGGRLRYSAVENVVNPGSFAIEQPGAGARDMARGQISPAWDNDLLVAVSGRQGRPVGYECRAVVDHLKKPGSKGMPRSLWDARALDGSEILGLALAKDAVIVECRTPQQRSLQPRWRVALLDRETGALLCDHDLPGPPRMNGLAVDRDGRILVALADGTMACFGGEAMFRSHVKALVQRGKEHPDTREDAVNGLRAALDVAKDTEGRTLVIGGLRELGEDLCRAAKEAGAVCEWQLLGPAPWDPAQDPMDKVLIGEPNVDGSHPCQVAGESLQWREFVTADLNGKVDLANLYGSLENRAVYAYAEVALPQDADLLLKVGSNDGFKCWFNGKEVGRFDGGRRYVEDQDSLPVRAKAGTNTVLLKVTQEGGAWAFGVRITDRAGKPIDLFGAHKK